jgi:hypothetical protein
LRPAAIGDDSVTSSTVWLCRVGIQSDTAHPFWLRQSHLTAMANGTRRGTLIRRLSQPICNHNLWPNSVKAGGLIPIRIAGCLMALTTLPTLSFSFSNEFPIRVE